MKGIGNSVFIVSNPIKGLKKGDIMDSLWECKDSSSHGEYYNRFNQHIYIVKIEKGVYYGTLISNDSRDFLWGDR